MKRLTLSVLMTSVLGIAAYTMAGAQPPDVGAGGGRPGPGGPGRGFGRGAIGILRDANLTDQQRTEIRAILDAERDSRQGPPPEASLHRQLQAEVFADTPDAAKLSDLQQQIAQAASARLSEQIALEQKIAQVLTAEQRAKVREQLANAPARRGPGGRRGPDRQPAEPGR